jgi:hypothetical protein
MQISEADLLLSLARSISTYTEQPSQSAIQPKIERARMVAFLGFGFHQQNIDLLRARAESWRRAYATVLQMNTYNYSTMRVAIETTVGSSGETLLFAGSARMLLVEFTAFVRTRFHKVEEKPE